MVTVITCTGTGNISSFLVVNANGGGGGVFKEREGG